MKIKSILNIKEVGKKSQSVLECFLFINCTISCNEIHHISYYGMLYSVFNKKIIFNLIDRTISIKYKSKDTNRLT